MRTTVVFAVLAAVACAATADAQQVARPARPYRGLFGGGPPVDPNRTRTELQVTATLTGGFGDVIAPGGSTVGPTPRSERGVSTIADGTLRYWHGRTGKFVAAEGRGFWSGYSAIDVDPLIGGSGQLRAESSVSRRSTVQASVTASLDPTLVLGSFGALQSDVGLLELPETGQTSGFAEQRSAALIASGGLTHRWASRQATDAMLSYSQRNYLDDFGFDSRSTSLAVNHNVPVGRYVSVRSSYRFGDTSLIESADRTIPLTEHSAESGLSYTRRLSPTREIHLSGGAGATHVDTIATDAIGTDRVDRPISYWVPSGHGTFRWGFRRSWSASTDYRRGVSVLQGVTVRSFTTDAVTLSTTGWLTRRLELLVSAGYSGGSTDIAETVSQFTSQNAVTRLRVALSRCCAVTAQYDYYRYRLNDVPDVPLAIPTRYERNSIQVGVVLWLPLYGTYSGGEGNAGRGRD